MFISVNSNFHHFHLIFHLRLFSGTDFSYIYTIHKHVRTYTHIINDNSIYIPRGNKNRLDGVFFLYSPQQTSFCSFIHLYVRYIQIHIYTHILKSETHTQSHIFVRKNQLNSSNFSLFEYFVECACDLKYFLTKKMLFFSYSYKA